MRSWPLLDRVVAGVLLMAFGSWSCGVTGEHPSEEAVEETDTELTIEPDIVRVLGFEDPRDWRSNARLSRSESRTEGRASLAVSTKGGRVFVGSVRVGPLPELRPQLGFDLMVPSMCELPQHFWHRRTPPPAPAGGRASLFVSSQSAGLHHRLVGTASLSEFPPGVWRSLTFPLSDGVLARLRAVTRADVTFKIVLDVPAGCERVYKIDNLNKRPVGVHLPPGRATVEGLRAEPDSARRALIATFLLNGMCLMKRATSRIPVTPLEQELRTVVESVDAATREDLRNSGDALTAITSAERAELLGPYAALDPGSCDVTPGAPPPPIVNFAAQALAQVPRHRGNACTNAIAYEGDLDPAAAARAVTVGSTVAALGDPIEGIPDSHAPAARPVVMGIEKADPYVTGYDAGPTRPSLERDRLLNRDCGATGGDGYFPYGIETDIPCSLTASCDAEAGLLCGADLDLSQPRGLYRGDVCYAFPVVTPNQNLVIKGYNFWDARDTQLEYVSLADPSRQPIFVPLTGQGIIGHEGTTAVPNCQIPVGRGSPGTADCVPPMDPGNRTHNSAMFPVPSDVRGAFFRLRMMNHNTDQPAGAPFGSGRFRHWNAPGEAGRVLHVCYLPTENPIAVSGLATLIPIDARRNCQPPGLTCSANNGGAIGQCATGTWSAAAGLRPRSLSQCRHLAGTPPVCGETPEWFYSDLRPMPATGAERFPIVFASSNEQIGYKLVQRLYAARCHEETGWDWTGSDELRVATAGFRWDPMTREMTGATQFWDGGNFDSTDENLVPPRYIDPPSIASVVTPVGLNDSISYTVNLFERDCADDDLACRVLWVSGGLLAGTLAVWAITAGAAAVCPPCAAAVAAALATPAGGAAGAFGTAAVAAAYTLWLWETSRHDRLGSAILGASPPAFGERFTVSHMMGFTSQPEGQIPGPLPTLPGAGNRGSAFNTLVRPAGPDFPGGRILNPLETDSTGTGKLIGFREERVLTSDGSSYRVQFLWQRIRCDTVQECAEVRVNQDPTLPTFDPGQP